jgi:DNA-directed RNA polymerase sigma subunit (sigma70/sigma32)
MKRNHRARKSILPDLSHPEGKTRPLLAALPPQEERIVRMRLGVDSEVYSAKEVAQLLRISEGEVNAVEDKFLGRLRQT